MVNGIDVSEHQRVVDFNKVRKAGYDFVMIRAGYGMYTDQKDPYFEDNYKNAKAAGLSVGTYWFSYAKTAEQAKREAEVFLDTIKGKEFDYPVAFDIEHDSQRDLPNSVVDDICRTFCDTVEKAGYYVVLYSYKNFILPKISAGVTQKYDMWLAEYTNAEKPTYNRDYGIWQYSSTGTVSGVDGNVDLNRSYKDYPEIIKSAGLNGYKKGENVSVAALDPFDTYFAKWLGRGIDFDGVYGVQCFDLANHYSVNLVGGKQFLGMGAYEIYTNFDNQPAHELYERIPNTPEFIPQKGDIMVWGTGIGEYGHVAICNGEGDTTWFNSYDQNWGYANAPVTLIKHSYASVLGVLRPKDQTKIRGLKGDANLDGQVNVSDIAVISAHIKGITPISEALYNADVNNDGKIDVADIAAISAHIKGVAPIKQPEATVPKKPASRTPVKYKVKAGDTLSAIAQKYDTTYAKIAEDNGIKNPNLIYPGQVLTIR